jgi:hypothetical protein
MPMKLLDLFEQSFDQPMPPGAKRTRTDITTRDLTAILDKIRKLNKAFNDSVILKDRFQQDTALQTALEKLINRINLKISYLHKMGDKPTQGQKKIIPILQQECSEWINLIKENHRLLYTSIRQQDSVFEAHAHPEVEYLVPDKINFPEITQTFDQALKNSGYTAFLTNSMWVTTDQWEPRGAGGITYVIFPKNGFQILQYNNLPLTMGNFADRSELDEFVLDLKIWIKSHIPESGYNDLGNAVKAQNYLEILHQLKMEFSYRGNRWKIPPQFDKSLTDFINDQAIINTFDPQQLSAHQFTVSSKTCRIRGEYWAFRYDLWNTFLEQSFIYNQD